MTPNEDRTQRASHWRVIGAGVALIALTALGTLGYVWIEGASFTDALYFTVITLTTVGYGETFPLSPAGRWFTMALLAFGVGLAFYTVVALAAFVFEGELRSILGRRSMQQTIDQLRDHVVVCGFGRLGREVARHLEEAGTPFLVIESDPKHQDECEQQGYLCVRGSALDERMLERAGLARASAIVAATASDADNVFIALSARDLNPGIEVHARAETPIGVRRLQQAGASQVISPHQLGGQRIANAIARPALVEFIELTTPGSGDDVDLEELQVGARSPLCGVTLDALPARGVRVSVMAIKPDGEPLRLNPGARDALRGGDRLIVVGDRANLARLAELASD